MFRKAIKAEVEEQFGKISSDVTAKVRDGLRKDIEGICKKLIFELFSDQRDTRVKFNYWSNSFDIDTLRGSLKKSCVDGAKGEIDKIVGGRVKSAIHGEKFIDDIVDRIKKKQICG